MKASLYKILPNDQCSFQVNDRDQNDHFDNLHYHPEYQLSLIMEGEGACAVGALVDQFQKGDVFQIGPNVPHAFRTDDPHTRYRILSFFFQENGFGKDFFQLPELLPVKNMLEESARGIKIGSQYVKKLQTDLTGILELTGILRLMTFLRALADIALHPERRILSAVSCQASPSTLLHHRLNAIFEYISDNFDRPISLEEAAGVANLSKYAFCRYFKKYTRQSFVDYLNQFRVNVACRLLKKSACSIIQISLLSGFNNLSNFNRHFKRIMDCTPTEYRDRFFSLSAG